MHGPKDCLLVRFKVDASGFPLLMKRRLTNAVGNLIELVAILYPLASALGGESNAPPDISLIWPRDGYSFGAVNTAIKIKANVSSNAVSTVTQVQFFVETDLIGTITNAPLNLVWQVWLPGVVFGYFDLRAVAMDSFGRKATSAPVNFYYSSTQPPFPVVEMLSPPNGSVFAAPASVVFSAEVLASQGDAGPLEFFVDDDSVGVASGSEFLRATNPPVSVVVSNLAEGEHKLQVKYLGGSGGLCYCNWITNKIRVVRLEMRSPRLNPQARFQCQVVASLPGIKTIVQVSPDLVAWTPITTNQPPGTTFTFTDPSPATNAQTFYRLALPPP